MKLSTLAIIATLSLSSVSTFAAAAGLPATVTCDINAQGKGEGLSKSASIVIHEGKNDKEERSIILRQDGTINEVEVSIELSGDALDIEIFGMDSEENDLLEAKSSIPLTRGDTSLTSYVSNKLVDQEGTLLTKVSIDCTIE